MSEFRGSLVAIVSPFRDGELDLEAFSGLVEWHLASGTSGIVVAGTTGEAATLRGLALTPLGAERAGNADGSIPAWTGGITEPPPAYVKGRHHPDPYPDDPVVRTITAGNLDQHAERLSAGQQALLRASRRLLVDPVDHLLVDRAPAALVHAGLEGDVQDDQRLGR